MCLFPRFVNYKIVDGKYELDFKSTGLLHNSHEHALKLRCGNCPECWQAQSTEWAIRCYLETKLHKQNCVLTLTYSNTSSELVKRDYQLFIKRLRKSINVPIKYFLSGEYGSLRGRPHFHLIIFGWCPDDLIPLKKSSLGTMLYTSPFVVDKWQHGFISVDPDVTYQSCFYSAKYMQKAVSQYGVKHFQPPFISMSKGIAQYYADKFSPWDDCHVYINGRVHYAPRYFFKRFEMRCGSDALELYRVFNSCQKFDLLNLPLYGFSSAQRRVLSCKVDSKKSSNIVKLKLFEKKLST